MTLLFKQIKNEGMLNMLFNLLLMKRVVIYDKFEGEAKEAYIYREQRNIKVNL